MLNLIDWSKEITVNNVVYSNSSEAYEAMKDYSGPIEIVLNAKKPSDSAKSDTDGGTSEVSNEESVEFRVRVRAYMTKPPTEDFDFATRYNNGIAVPLREMHGTVIGETRGMYKMKLHGKLRPTKTCIRCGRTLAEPVSMLYGVGPECCEKMGIIRCATEEEVQDALEYMQAEAEEICWEGWLPKKSILEMEVVDEA